MGTTQHTLNVQDFATKLASELSYFAQLSSSAGGLTGEQIADCASDVLRIDFRCSDVRGTIDSLPDSIRPFLAHAFDDPKMKTVACGPSGCISRLETVAATKT